jgi:hypothetical protein
MQKFGNRQGSHFAIGIPKGSITIEVKKEGYLPYREVLTVKPDASEHYLYVKLSSKSKL